MKNISQSNASIKIKSIQANSLYAVNNFVDSGKTDCKKPYLDLGEAVINNSLFSDYMLHHGVTVNKKNRSKDFIVLKFDYGVKENKEMTARRLRDYYYQNGAEVTWETHGKEGNLIGENKIRYKMLMRSPGKAKDGDCIFVRENLHEVALKYITMDLYRRMPIEGAKIVELSAYSTLTTATAVDYITIPLDNMLIIKDKKVSTMIHAVSVKTNQNGECYVDRTGDKVSVSNVLWDGMGLIDDSIFPKGMKGFIYCRSHFFKSCLFHGSIQEYFKDFYGDKYDMATVTDMFGKEFFVKDIKVIITENSIKWLTFADLMGKTNYLAYKYYRRFMKRNDYRFAIVKTAHSSKYGDFQRNSYQQNNSVPYVNREGLERIAQPSIDYCNKLKTNHEAFMHHLAITCNQRYSINNVLVALDQWNEDFKYTDYFKEKKRVIISKFKNEKLKGGKLLLIGDNLTICGNPIALLMKVTGQDFLKEPCFKQIDTGIQCYTTRFKDGERLAGFRSPHNAPNNIVHLVNTYSEPIQKYFSKLGNNVIIINGIYTDVQSRLNGQDLDSDFIFTTNQPDMVRSAQKAYLNYPTIINDIQLKGTSVYKKDMRSYAEMDGKISSAQHAIGYASNIAQLALSYYFDGDCENKESEDVFIICSVLAQVAIDSAKRTFDVDVNSELRRLSKLPCMKRADGKKFPKFYADIQKRRKHNYSIKESDIGKMNCPMEILCDILEDGILDLRHNKDYLSHTYDLSTVFRYKPDRMRNSRQQDKIISIVKEYDREFKKLNALAKGYSKKTDVLSDNCMMKLKKYYINKGTMSALINYAFHSDCGIHDRLLTLLYDKDPDKFLSCFKKNAKIFTLEGQKSL